MTKFTDISRNMHFLGKTMYRLPGKSVGDALKVLVKYLKTTFHEVYFIVNLLYQNSIKQYEDNLGHLARLYIILDSLYYFQMCWLFANKISIIEIVR